MTRGDFYIGTGLNAMWIGSICHDAFPDKIPCGILIETNKTMFEKKVIEFLKSDRASSDIPSEGDRWPWPWGDSRLTDYVYMFDLKKEMVVASYFGCEFFNPIKIVQGEDLMTSSISKTKPKFPLMKMVINKDGSYTT